MTDEKRIREKIIHIDGLSCSSCVKKIEKKLSSCEGVEKVKVRLDKDAAKVRYDPGTISLDDIHGEIEGLGYSIWGKDSPKAAKKSYSSMREAIAYGVFPHIGCIAFILGSVLGVTFMMTVFRPLLMNRYIFHIMVGMSILFATVSSVLYLKKHDFLHLEGIKRKWKYLTTMYSVTIGANVLLLLVVFPMVASATGGNIDLAGVDHSEFRMDVDIPCAGHAPLIMEETRALDGVYDVEYVTLGKFDVRYDPDTITVEEIFSIEVFQNYPAELLEGGDDSVTAEAALSGEGVEEGCTYDGEGSCGTPGCTGGCGRCAADAGI